MFEIVIYSCHVDAMFVFWHEIKVVTCQRPALMS